MKPQRRWKIAACAVVCAPVLAVLLYLQFSPHVFPRGYWPMLRSCKSVELLSLEPNPSFWTGTLPFQCHGLCHRFPIIGVAPLTATESKRLVEAVWNGTAPRFDPIRMACGFQPRHALRFHLSDTRICDVLICFHCGQIELYDGDTKIVFGQIRGGAEEFTAVRTAHQLPLAP